MEGSELQKPFDMERYGLYLLLLLFPFSVIAQDGTDDEGFEWDNEEWGDWKDDINYDDTTHQLTNWAGIDLAVTGYLAPDHRFDLPSENGNWTLDYSRSIGWNLNLFETRFPIVGRHFGLVTGLGFDWDRYAFERNVSIGSKPDSTWAYEDGTDYDKNKLKTTFLRVPLLLELNTSEDPEKSFHLSVGVIGGWRIHSKFDQEFTIDGTEHHIEKVAKFNVNSFRYSLTTRLGYDDYNLFFEYSPMPLFERGEGPELYPFSAGVTILGI